MPSVPGKLVDNLGVAVSHKCPDMSVVGVEWRVGADSVV